MNSLLKWDLTGSMIVATHLVLVEMVGKLRFVYMAEIPLTQ